MNISFDVQPLCSHSLSGIGWYTYNITKNLIHNNINTNFTASFFDFMNRNSSETLVRKILGESENLSYNRFSIFPYGVYLRSQNIFKYITYENLLGLECQIAHFFNYLIPKNIKSRTVLTVYDMVYKKYPETMTKSNYKLLKNGTERSCNQADIVLTISQSSKKDILEYLKISEDKIKIAYPAVDRNFFRPIKVDNQDVLLKYGIYGEYILYLGTLEPRKNIINLLKAFKIVGEKNKHLKLVVAGSKGWSYDSIFKTVEDLSLAEKVIFTGYVNEDDKPYIYSAAEVFVFPSFYEGFGIPPLEAMCCGTPVIVSNTSSLPEVIEDAGIFFTPNNFEELAYKILTVLESQSLKRELSEKGLVQATKFSWDKSSKIIFDIYKSLS